MAVGRSARTEGVVLAYRALGLGDLLAGVPALRALRRALPRHRLVLATDPALAPLTRLIEAVDELCPAGPLEAPAWPHEPPDVAVNLHGRGPQSHHVLTALRPGRLVAFRCDDAGVDGPEWRDDEHEVRRWCRLVESELKVPAPEDDLLLRPPQEPPPVERATVIHPGAKAPARRWPVERFAEVARRLHAEGRNVVVTGSAGEVTLADAVCRAAGLPETASLAGRTSPGELAALIARAQLLISNDTGTAHLASAFRTPSVVLFGPVSPARWGPPPSGPHIALWRGVREGDPHGERLDPALASIQPDEVIDAAERLLVPAPSA